MNYLMAAGVDYIIGGFRTESTRPAREIAMDNKKIFMIAGAATNDLVDDVTPTYQNTVRNNYARYKYVFRMTPINASTLIAGVTGQWIAAKFGYATYIFGELAKIFGDPVPYATIIENLAWTSTTIPVLANWTFTQMGYPDSYPYNQVGVADIYLGSPNTASNATKLMFPGTYTVAGHAKLAPGQVYLMSPTTTDLTTQMTAIKNSGAKVIITWTAAENVGRAIVNAWKQLQVPAIIIGLNTIDQQSEAWPDTNGAVKYETFMATTGTRTPLTYKAIPFWDAYEAKWGRAPVYTAYGVYDGIYLFKEACDRALTTPGAQVDTDKVVVAMEATDRINVNAKFKFTGPALISRGGGGVCYAPFIGGIGNYTDEPTAKAAYLAAYDATWTNGTATALTINPNAMGTLHDVYSVDIGATSPSGYARGAICQWADIPRSSGALEVVFPTDQIYSVKTRLPYIMYPLWDTDVNHDKTVDGQDMQYIRDNWLKSVGVGANVNADLNSDGIVDISDASRLGHDYGTSA